MGEVHDFEVKKIEIFRRKGREKKIAAQSLRREKGRQVKKEFQVAKGSGKNEKAKTAEEAVSEDASMRTKVNTSKRGPCRRGRSICRTGLEKAVKK